MAKIPSSLKWLVNRRARVKGLIEASEREIQRLAKFQDRLPALRLDLEALDRILRLHEISIEGDTIPSIRPQVYSKLGLRKWFTHGEIRRTLLGKIAESGTGKMSTIELANELLSTIYSKYPDEVITRSEILRFNLLVYKSLKGMCARGKIERVIPAKVMRANGGIQEWKLPMRNGFHRPI